MSRPLSQLVYVRVRDDSASPRIITLHGENQFALDVKDHGIAAAPHGRVIALESYKGVFSGRKVVGYTWLVGPDAQPSPMFFGDALSEIERFLWDEVDRQETPEAELPFLVGVGQGGIMALAAAAAVPDLLSGVIAIDTFLPVVPGWEPPLAPLDGLPILTLERVGASPAPDGVLAGDQLVTTLQAWGATVETASARAEIPGDEMTAWVARQPVRTRSAAGES